VLSLGRGVVQVGDALHSMILAQYGGSIPPLASTNQHDHGLGRDSE
jgi:hypothetical protein